MCICVAVALLAQLRNLCLHPPKLDVLIKKRFLSWQAGPCRGQPFICLKHSCAAQCYGAAFIVMFRPGPLPKVREAAPKQPQIDAKHQGSGLSFF